MLPRMGNIPLTVTIRAVDARRGPRHSDARAEGWGAECWAPLPESVTFPQLDGAIVRRRQ